MSSPERTLAVRTLSGALVAALAISLAAPLSAPAQASIGPIPTPCDLPGAAFICDVIATTAKEVVQATGDYIMRGLTSWVTEAAVWVTGKVGGLIEASASPDVQAGWFEGQYASMLAVAAALALPMLLLALIQALWRQDLWILLRSAFGYLPMAFILAAAAIVATQLVISVSDDLSGMVVQGLGGSSGGFLQSVGDAYTRALADSSGNAVPLFGIFLGAIILAVGAFVLWLELIIRDAAIYIALFFLPLTFVAMIWPATGRWARRLVELLVAVILAKFVIVSIISLATAAITNTTLAQTGGNGFEPMIAGAALLVLAAWSPFALLRLIPMMVVAASTVASQRATFSSAAGSAGVQSPAAYMRQAIDRHSRPSTSSSSASAPQTTYLITESGLATTSSESRSSDRKTASSSTSETESSSVRTDARSEAPGSVMYRPPSSSGAYPATETHGARLAAEERRSAPPQPPAEPPSSPTGSSLPPERPRPPRLPPDEE